MNMLMSQEVSPGKLKLTYTAISKEVVGKSARDKPKRYFGWFWVHCSSNKFKRIAQEVTDLCLRVLKESNKSSFDSYSVRNSVYIDHIPCLPFGIAACTFFPTTFLEIAVYALLTKRKVKMARCWPSFRVFIGGFIVTSLVTVLLISIRVLTHRICSQYQLGSQIKELVNLCSLCKFQLFAISNKGTSSYQKRQNFWVGKR